MVTAADGVSTQVYTLNIHVNPSTNTDLSVFTLNTTPVVDGATVELPYGTTSVDVVAETADPDASVEVSGDTGLVVGDQLLTVTVTAADGVTSKDRTVTLRVAASSDDTDTSLSSLTVNDTSYSDGDTVTLDAGSTATVNAVPTDSRAVAVVYGADDLAQGDNPVTIVVTAADGVSSQIYYLTIHLNPSTNTDLSVFTVNTTTVVDGATVELPYGTTSVDVVAETADPDASFEVFGSTDLVSDN